MTDFKKLKVVELRAELAARNLIQSGKRDELIERLEEYEFNNAVPVGLDAIDIEVVDESKSEQEPSGGKTSIDEYKDNVTSSSPCDISKSSSSSPAIPSSISPPTHTSDLQAIEEEKRLQRALRFGIDTSGTPTVNIEIAIKRLDHALPNRSRYQRGRRHHHNNNHVRINKP